MQDDYVFVYHKRGETAQLPPPRTKPCSTQKLKVIKKILTIVVKRFIGIS